MSNYGSVNDAVEALIQQQVADGRQIGVQVCAYKDGEVVVDTCAGHMGPNDSRPVQADSLFLSFSMTKGVATTVLHILADKGLIEYDVPVARYWPGFAANGKEKITVAQAMSHQAGLHAMPTPFKHEHLTEWEAGIHWIEEGVPAWEPGTAVGYHGVTFSWIVGGIVAAVTGRHIKDVIRSEIAQPLSIANEMFVGIPDGVEDRLTTLAIWNFDQVMKERGLTLSPESDTLKAMPLQLWPHFNSMAVRKACLPAANGHFSARALAKMYAALSIDGSIEGVCLVSPERIAAMQRLEVEGMDRVTGTVSRKGIGFFHGGIVNGIYGPMGPHTTAFGHGGAGGSIGFADPESRLAIAVTLNKMEFAVPGQGRAQEICDLIRQELGVT